MSLEKTTEFSTEDFQPADLPVTSIPMVLGSPLSRSPSLLSLISSRSISNDIGLIDDAVDLADDELAEEDEFLEDLYVQISEENIPEMVHIYKRKLSYIINAELRNHLKDDFDKILTVKNKRLWRLSHHMTQNLKIVTDYYRSQLDVKEYQLFLYRTKLKVMIKHMVDMAEKQDNKLAREHFNHYLSELLQAPPDNAFNAPDKAPSMFENLSGESPSSLTLARPSTGRRGFFKSIKKFFTGR